MNERYLPKCAERIAKHNSKSDHLCWGGIISDFIKKNQTKPIRCILFCPFGIEWNDGRSAGLPTYDDYLHDPIMVLNK